MGAVIELEGLGVRLAGRRILEDLSVSISGRSIGLLGPNGAGKTTLIHTLLGFFPAAEGTARVFGRDIRTERRAIRSLIGYMAELSGLPPSAALERAHEALFYVGLGEARYRRIETFSLGMKQRVKLAQAIVHAPRLIVLDEPTNGLDPPARLRMIRLIRDIRDSGEVHLMLSSHLLRDVEECCDEVVVLKNGRLAAYTNLEEERRAHKHFLEVETRGEGDGFTRGLDGLGVDWAVSAGSRIKMILPDGVEIRDLYRIAAESDIQIRRLDHKRDSLQDIFMKAMEDERRGGV